jgi:preprotein translocase subunit SecB
MKKAPITLLEYFVTDLTVSANREYKAAENVEFREADFIAEPTVMKIPTQEAPKRWQVTLTIKYVPAPDSNFPYAYNVVMVGFFRAEDSVKPENEERMVRIQGASVLYGMARELVRAMTGRGPHRAVLLPTASFYDPPPQQPKSPTAPAPSSTPAP